MKISNVELQLIPAIERCNPDIKVLEWDVFEDTNDLYIKAQYGEYFTYDGYMSVKAPGLDILCAFCNFTDDNIKAYWAEVDKTFNKEDK